MYFFKKIKADILLIKTRSQYKTYINGTNTDENTKTDTLKRGQLLILFLERHSSAFRPPKKTSSRLIKTQLNTNS
jgi:hypothetical protein